MSRYEITESVVNSEPTYGDAGLKVSLRMIALNLAYLCDELKLLREDLHKKESGDDGRM